MLLAGVQALCSPYEANDDRDCDDLEYILNVTCRGGDTLDVTSNDLQPNNVFPKIVPVGAWWKCALT